MNRHNSFTPREEIKENDLINVNLMGYSVTAIVSKAPYKDYWKQSMYNWKIDLDINGIEYNAYWSIDEKRWILYEEY